MTTITLIALAILIALIVGGLAILLGRVTKTIPAPITAAIGGWLEQFGWGIGVIAGLWFFFTGGKLPWS